MAKISEKRRGAVFEPPEKKPILCRNRRVFQRYTRIMTLRFILALLYTFSLALGSLVPLSGNLEGELVGIGLDKLFHVLAFLLFFILWYFARPNAKRWILVLSSFGFGIALEALQSLLPLGRTYNPYDILANGLGVFIAWLGFWVWHQWTSRDA